MRFLYTILSWLTKHILSLVGLFNHKIHLFVSGRKHVFETLKKNISSTDKLIWFHAASLGEYEQGVPVMEAVRRKMPGHKILVTFFSPSGYEIKKNNSIAAITVYLPLDTQTNARKFVELVSPDLVFFIKYEVWPNYLAQLQQRKIPTYLISGVFRKNQVYFKPYGTFMRNALKTFKHLFVQDQASYNLLMAQGFRNVTLSGDTRFDRVNKQLEMNNSLWFIEEFKNQQLCIVCGSTWPEDDALLIPFINSAPAGVKFIIAPHQIKPNQLKALKAKLPETTISYSEKEQKSLQKANVLLVDTIGLLSKIYSYADIAYVGGAMGKTGMHNILEPAVFGVPIIIGKNYQKFPEAKALLKQKGLFSVQDKKELHTTLTQLIDHKEYRIKTGQNSKDFIELNKGATQKILAQINI